MNQVKISKLKCDSLKSNQRVFFSLVDYRNNYYSNSDPKKIKEFYDGLENRNQLIQWMKERPMGVNNIFEIEGEKTKDIIVVIPTADYYGIYAKQCRDNIFKGLHIIFVESGRDYYFNYAHNCNLGVKRALKYDPKWIVVSNDDMVKIDDVEVLIKELSKLNHEKLKTVFTGESSYHSYNTSVGTRRRFIGHIGYLVYYLIQGKLREFLGIEKILKKYHVSLHQGPRNPVLSKLFLKERHTFVMGSCFSIFSKKWCEEVEGNIYNECYINGVEDWEQSIILTKNTQDYSFIDYKVGDLVGKTMPGDCRRSLRDVSNLVYFNTRINGLLGKNNNL